MSAIQCSSFKVMRKLTWTQIFNLKKILIQRQYFFSEKKRGVRCLTVPPRSCLFAHFRHFVFVSVCSMALSDDSWPGGPFWLMAAHPVARFVGQSPTSNNRVGRHSTRPVRHQLLISGPFSQCLVISIKTSKSHVDYK